MKLPRLSKRTLRNKTKGLCGSCGTQAQGVRPSGLFALNLTPYALRLERL